MASFSLSPSSRTAGRLAALAAAVALSAYAAPAARGQETRTFTGSAQVTAVELILDVRDASGGVPADLTPADFEVLEDGAAQTVLAVEPFRRGTVAAQPADREPAAAPRPAAEPAGSPWSWRVVIYIDQALSSSRSIRRAAETLAAQAGRLVELGAVEVVLANPEPEVVLRPTRSGRLLEQTLERLARETSGRDAVRRVRQRFLDAMQIKGEFDGRGYGKKVGVGGFGGGLPTRGSGGDGGGEAGGNAAGGSQDPGSPDNHMLFDGSFIQREHLIRAALFEEKMLLTAQHDAMMAWLAASPIVGPRALVLVNDGFDLDPRAFYLAGTTASGKFFAEVGSAVSSDQFGPNSERLAMSLAAAGWVTVSVASGALDAGATIAAEISGRGRLGDLAVGKQDTLTDVPASIFAQPLAPLRLIADATGGDVLTGTGRLPAALADLGDRVRLTYQVSRRPDGRLHEVAVRARRSGLEVRAPRWSGAPPPEAVASSRARRLLAGDVDRGELPVTAALALAAPAAGDAAGEETTRRATLQARLDLTSIQESLAGGPRDLRVTLAVSFPRGEPFVHTDLVAGQALAGIDAWTFTAPLALPAEVERVAVVLEEVGSGGWGGTLAPIVHGPLPDAAGALAAGAAAAVGVGRAAAGPEVPADLLPGRKVLALLPPPDAVALGKLRFETLVTDARVARVAFRLDDREAAVADAPPFVARLDLGALPAPHTVEAVAYGRDGAELGRDAVELNRGAGAFRVRLIEPRSGDRVGLVDVEAEVQLPADAKLDRLELLWRGEKVATLFEPPFRQRVRIAPEDPVGYLTAQAVLADGSVGEDVVFLNAAGTGERVDVRLVELPTVVTEQASRRLVRDLPADVFQVFDEGRPQDLAEFADGSEAPLHLGLVLDSSGSMYPVLSTVQAAAIDFLMAALRDQDRGFVVDFATRPRLAQAATGDRSALVAAVAGLQAAGGSALCDALVFSLVQMQGVSGRKALVVLTDGVGRDERVSFATCQRTIEHAGVPIYAVLLAGDDPTAGESGVTSDTLARLVAPVGGRLYHAQGAGAVYGAYRSILEEIRSQYLLTFYPGQVAESGWRMVKVEVDRPGLAARTIAGYYP